MTPNLVPRVYHLPSPRNEVGCRGATLRFNLRNMKYLMRRRRPMLKMMELVTIALSSVFKQCLADLALEHNCGHYGLKLTINKNQFKCWFLRRGKNPSTRIKTSPNRVENQQNRSIYDAEYDNRTHATLVGGECSHHKAIDHFHNGD